MTSYVITFSQEVGLRNIHIRTYLLFEAPEFCYHKVCIIPNIRYGFYTFQNIFYKSSSLFLAAAARWLTAFIAHNVICSPPQMYVLISVLL